MILTLILLSSFLSLTHYLGLGEPIAWVINLPLTYHIGFTITLIGLRVGMALCKWVQVWTDTLRKLRESIERLNSRNGNVSGQASNSSPGSNKNKGARGIHTSAFSRSEVAATTTKTTTQTKKRINPLAAKAKAIFGKTQIDKFFRIVAKQGALVSLSSGSKRPTISNLFKVTGFRMFGAVFTKKGKYLSRLRQLYAFLVRLQTLRRNHGDAYVVKELKVSQLALQKAIAGTPVSSLRVLEPTLPLSRVTNQGFPKWIPLRDRRLMMQGNSPSIIRWYMTLFAVYRVIYIPGILKLSTITESLTVSKESVDRVARDIKGLIPVTSFDLEKLFNHNLPAFKVDRAGIPPIPLLEAASSTNAVSWLGMVSDIAAFKARGEFDTLCYYLYLTENYSLLKLVIHLAENIPLTENMLPVSSGLGAMLANGAPLGRLSLKEEAAGKVRVFAMVSIWDQTVLSPLHDALFAWLKLVPNDATFDQNASVRRCLSKSVKTQQSYGYDLSAATDRLPLSFQQVILNRLVPSLGDIWGLLLTHRSYMLAEQKKYNISEPLWLRYAVGQPMGAKSSWAMLAVSHHLIAQGAAWEWRLKQGGDFADPHGFWIDFKGYQWYIGYEVLGDDIVFFEHGPALEYLIYMDRLGVPINQAKSVLARNATFEFAKVTGHNGRHVAAISWAMFMSQPTAMGRVGICYALLMKGIVDSHFIRYITTLSRESKYIQGSPNIFFVALGTMFAKAGRLRYKEFFGSILTFKPDQVSLTEKINQPNALANLARAIAAILSNPDTYSPVEIQRKVSEAVNFEVSATALAHALASTVTQFVYGKLQPDGYRVDHLNPYEDAMKISKKIIVAQVAFGYEAQDQLQAQLESEGAFKLVPGPYHRLSPVGKLLHPLYCVIFAQVYESLNKKYEILAAVKPTQMKSLPIPDLMNLLDVIARYKEITEIWGRAYKKLADRMDKNPAPAKNLIENPLEVLLQILKSETNIAYMRGVVLSTGIQAVQRLIQQGGSTLESIFSPEKDVVDKTDWNTGLAPAPLEKIRAYISEFGEEFVLTHLPKWGNYAGMMFKEPLDVPMKEPYNIFIGQPSYLYAISALDYILPDSVYNKYTSEEGLFSHLQNPGPTIGHWNPYAGDLGVEDLSLDVDNRLS
jgi:hypothetical protein